MHLPTWGEFLHDVIDKATNVDPVLRATQRMQFVQGKLRPTPCEAGDLEVLCERIVTAYRLQGVSIGKEGRGSEISAHE
jgi:hypothetical protein